MSTGVDTTVCAAFAAGFVSFVSPCVLPLVPGYLSAVSGVSVADVQSGKRRSSDVLLPAVVFCLSFTAVFVALGAAALGWRRSASRRADPERPEGAGGAAAERLDSDLERYEL